MYRVAAPPVRMQEKRFDWYRMLNAVERLEREPDDLDEYTNCEEAKCTGKFCCWHKDHEMLGNICNWLIQCGRYALQTKNPAKRRERCVEVMTDFIECYSCAMEGKFDRVFPWGWNWYQFSITSTLMLFHYILVADERKRIVAADLILKIISHPQKSLGMKRDQANSVYMALPWIVAHAVKGTLEEAAQHEGYKYVVRYVQFAPVQKRKEQGLYIDYTYITHTNVLAYGYLKDMATLALPLLYFDSAMRNFLLDWTRCKRILAHRTIPYGTIGFYTRSSTLKTFTQADSMFGVEVIPTCLFLRMYGENYSFAVRGQNDWIAYYESDKTNNDMAQYWVQCRRVFFAGQEYKPTFPDVGFMHEKYWDSSKKKEVTSRVVIPTKTTTTTSFVNCYANVRTKNRPLRTGYVFAYGKIGILRHFYCCPEMRYDKRKNIIVGEHICDEYILCDYEKHTIDIWRVVNLAVSPHIMPFVLHGATAHQWTLHSSEALFHIHWDCGSRRITSSVKHQSYYPVLEEYYPPGIEIVNTDDTVILLDKGEPKIAMYPQHWTDLRLNFTTRYKGKELEFVFNVLTNQFWLAGLCIDKK